MSALPLQATIKQVGVWFALVLLVVLTSLLFSLLGTLCTAVAVGLMMGVARRWNWQTIPVSVVFPLAGLTLGQAAKADLDLQHRLIMAAVCFGAFWGVYALARLLMCLEQGGDTANSNSFQATSSSERNGTRELGNDARTLASAAAKLSLHDLQGTWTSEAGAWDGRAAKRKLEFSATGFALEVTDAAGRTRLEVRGDVRIEEAEGHPELRLIASRDNETGHSG